MKTIHNPLSLAAIAGGALLLTGCALDPMDLPNEEVYVRNFIEKYGIPDIEHTWSMAKSVEASAEVIGVSTGVVEVYTDYPGREGARLVGRMPIQNGKATGNVSMPAPAKALYMQVKDQDNTIRMVQEVTLDEKQASASLYVASIPDDEYLPTMEAMDYSAYIMSDMTRSYYYMFLDELSTQEERDNYTYPDAFKRFKDDPDLFYYPDPNNLNYKVEYLDENQHETLIPNLKYLKNLYYEMGPALSYKQVLAPIFDKYTYIDEETGETVTEDGVFKERVNNLDRYYLKPTGRAKLDPNVTFSVREEGPVTMQCTWRGTQTDDYFGYFYYKEDEEFSSEILWNVIPKFMFLTPDDVTKSSNLTQIKQVDSQYTDDESGWGDMTGMGFASCSDWTGQEVDRMIRGRKYYLAYYGENYDEPASYTFPTGIRIGYFLLKNNVIYFSDCKTEYELCRRPYVWGTDEGPLRRPFAAKFRMEGRTYVGFGDESGDKDLNDIVFIAENVYPDPVDITPPELKEEGSEPQTWTLACEDLGSTDDVDFNDVVLDVEYVAGETILTITPRAAGGTLVSQLYFREANNTDYTRLGEIHHLMSPQYAEFPADDHPMLNTRKTSHEVDPATVRSIVVSVPVDFDFASATDGFLSRIRITTRQHDQEDIEANVINAYIDIDGNGSFPQMLLLDDGWEWPTERINISRAYPDFKNWVKDHSATDWVKSRQSAHTVSHRYRCRH